MTELTGEATPGGKEIGRNRPGGNHQSLGRGGNHRHQARVRKRALQRIIASIREAQQQKAPSQRFTDKFSMWYTYFVLGYVFAMFFVWWLGFRTARTDVAGHSAFYRAMTLLVVSSPCALVLSIPSAVLAAIAFGARHGILFRGGAAVEKLAEIDTVALDKTGTLTAGELKIEIIESFPAGRENDIARLAFSLEKLSTHPLARAITLHGKRQNLQAMELAQFESVTGHGLRAKWNGRCFLSRQTQLGRGFPWQQRGYARRLGDSGVSEI